MAARDQGIIALRRWWSKTPLPDLGLTRFQDAIAYYDRQDAKFLETLGETVYRPGIDQSKVDAAMADLARSYGTKYPPRSEFYAALAKRIQTFTWKDAREVAAATASDIGSAVKWVGGIALVVGVVALVAYLAVTTRAGGKVARA